MPVFYKPKKKDWKQLEAKYPSVIYTFGVALTCISGLPTQYQQKYVDVLNSAVKELIKQGT